MVASRCDSPQMGCKFTTLYLFQQVFLHLNTFKVRKSFLKKRKFREMGCIKGWDARRIVKVKPQQPTRTHQRRAENNDAWALCDSVHGAQLPLRGDGRGQLDGEDFDKTFNAADRLLGAPSYFVAASIFFISANIIRAAMRQRAMSMPQLYIRGILFQSIEGMELR